MSPALANKFETDLAVVEVTTRNAATAAYTFGKNSHWNLWNEFCNAHCVDPFLNGTNNHIPSLQVFAECYNTLVGLEPFQVPSFPLHRNSHRWGSLIHANPHTASYIIRFNPKSGSSTKPIAPHSVSSQYQ